MRVKRWRRWEWNFRQVDEETVELTAVPSDLTLHVREALDAVLETFHEGHWDDPDERHRRWAKAWAERVAPKGEVAMPLAAQTSACGRPLGLRATPLRSHGQTRDVGLDF